MKRKTLIVAAGILLLLAVGLLSSRKTQVKQEIRSFEECVAAGIPVLESYPRQCRTADGQSFTEDIGNELEKIDLIRVTNPRPNQAISSPLVVEGEALGTWFFEASFPAKLFDAEENLLVTVAAQAQGDWMTEEFVPFRAQLVFTAPTGTGTLILEADNPSGLPQHSDELRIPVKFQ